ncbi:hypothetical protein [Luteolibacter luteus]|uniref:Uncharacterized protein n=1 Tax=Luteolibacter luteus TaxID=2728835 RepID=A0A858RGT3_9BACT|nr:hypothetical protein [Luteolibacter luteus]QJE95791.1 hypothetical protein HHL09_08325 [Luteolibacter luteus]
MKEFTDRAMAGYEERRRDHGLRLLAKLDRQIDILERQNPEGSRRAWLEDLRKEREKVLRYVPAG